MRWSRKFATKSEYPMIQNAFMRTQRNNEKRQKSNNIKMVYWRTQYAIVINLWLSERARKNELVELKIDTEGGKERKGRSTLLAAWHDLYYILDLDCVVDIYECIKQNGKFLCVVPGTQLFVLLFLLHFPFTLNANHLKIFFLPFFSFSLLPVLPTSTLGLIHIWIL